MHNHIRTKSLLRYFVAVAALLALGSAKAMPTAGIEFTSSTIDFTNGGWSLGYEFTANQGITVTDLGFYDDFGNGLLETHEVGIFNLAGNLLVSGLVSDGTGALLDGHFRYVSVAPTLLSAGENYIVTAVTGSENYTWDPVGFFSPPEVTFVQDKFISSTALDFPTSSSGGGLIGWFGGNFRFGSPTSVPEPSTLALLGIGLVGMGWARRRVGR